MVKKLLERYMKELQKINQTDLSVEKVIKKNVASCISSREFMLCH